MNKTRSISLIRLARRFQGMGRWIPARWRLPCRFWIQRSLGALEPEVAALPFLLAMRPGVALDVGANVGIYTYALHRLGRSVHAFEPQALCLETLNPWAELHPSITVHPMGVGRESANLTLYAPLDSRGSPIHTRASFLRPGSAYVQEALRVVALDELDLPPVAIIKIDVEGLEHSVLEGAAGILSSSRPAVLVEIDRTRQDQESVTATASLLEMHGYACHIWQKGKLVRLDSLEAAPTATYNFIYLPTACHK